MEIKGERSTQVVEEEKRERHLKFGKGKEKGMKKEW
jgi:hypothetical protein